MMISFSFPYLLLIFLFSIVFSAQALVPSAKTFKYVNEGTLFFGIVEYNANYRPLTISNHPFHLCFYNTTPNSFVLGLGMGTANSDSLRRWVWAANRARPVHENAVLSFGSNGNLILQDSNGHVAWETRTADIGVVDIQLLPNGNLVFLNKKGEFLWQSFHYPTDTLLVGQALRLPKISNKLVSSSSRLDDSPGPYSMVFTKRKVMIYFRAPNTGKPLQYADESPSLNDDYHNVTFSARPESDGDLANELGLAYKGANYLGGQSSIAQPKYNTTLSIYRLGYDGNIRMYTYFEKGRKDAWEETYTRFSKKFYSTECLLPERCGSLGVCDDDQCVGCPTPKGLVGWTSSCEPSKLPACGSKDVGRIGYYELDGVDHFMNSYYQGEGPMKIEVCKAKCSKDCKCAAVFYRKDTSMCLMTNQLNTLINATDSSRQERIAFIKQRDGTKTVSSVACSIWPLTLSAFAFESFLRFVLYI